MLEFKDKPRTISAFFYFHEPESIGNAVIINTLSFLAERFIIIIYTNQAEFLQSRMPEVQIILVPDINLAENSIFGMLSHWRRIAKILNSDKSEAVFIGHDSAPVALWLNKTCFQYVYQMHEMLGLDHKSGLSKIDQLIREYVIIRGIRASKANFVVSRSIIQYLSLRNCKNLYLTPHCVDLKKFSVPCYSEIHNAIFRKKEQGYFIVCYAGWISEERCLHLMLVSLSLAIMNDPKILFVIAGSDVHHTIKISDYFREKNLEGKFIMHGEN